MAKITSNVGGELRIQKENKGSSALVYAQTDLSGVSLKAEGVREAIEKLAEMAGFKTEPTGNGMGIIIQFPESPAVQERREELAYKFTGDVYDVAESDMKHAIEHIINGEKARGELK